MKIAGVDFPKPLLNALRAALNQRITPWRQGHQPKAAAPYHIRQADSEPAWEANQPKAVIDAGGVYRVKYSQRPALGE